MSLSLSFDIARSGLATTAEQSSIVSRNVASSGDANATRKSARVVTNGGGGVQVAEVVRIANAAMLDRLLSSTSAVAAQSSVMESIDRIDVVMGSPELEQTPTALLGKLQNALQIYAAAPYDIIRAQSVFNAASDLVVQLNSLSDTLTEVRSEADSLIADSVVKLNSLLSTVEEVNTKIIMGTQSGDDITDLLDHRDGLLKSISEEIEIRTITRADNDMVILTASGVTLFERVPRSVEFESMPVLIAGADGNVVTIDGVGVTAKGAPGFVSGGRIAGLASVRDDHVPMFMRQLDEIARVLVVAFAEVDQSATPSLPDRVGLFTYANAPAVPTAITIIDGLARDITINPNVDPAVGGDLFRLRDGGISDPGNPAYLYNPSGESGYSDRINAMIEAIDAQVSFDPNTNIGQSTTLMQFTSDSYGWLQELRSVTQGDLEHKTILAERSGEALLKVTGVNLDEEMVTLLDLERSYQASSRLISVIDSMFGALLAATG